MIKIKNKCKRISTKQIKLCIELLNKEYQNLNCVINFYQNKFQVLLPSIILSSPILEDFKEVWKGNICGLYCNLENRIDIYTFNRKDDNNLQLIYDLFHEIRHSYQKHNLKHKYASAINNYIKANKDFKKYQKQWIEQDANEFAKNTMVENKDKLNEIFNIDYEWNVG